MLNLDDIKKSKNVVELFDDLEDGKRELHKIGRSVVNGYKIDEQSTESWRKTVDEAMDIAKQVMTKKNFPWDGSANIKYPLICEAAINFAARIFPEVIPNDQTVGVPVLGPDPQGLKYDRADRVSTCMSYQNANSPDWKEHIDRLLHILPVVGTVFTKTYFSEIEKRNCDELCPPDQIIVNHNISSLRCARRITHLLKMSINDVISRQRSGLFNPDIDIDTLKPEDCSNDDDDFEIDLLEQHCWLDLDGDDYKEPYVVTVDAKSEKVLRIVNRIEPGSVEKNSKGEIIRMEGIQYFTDFHFIRSPDGGFYSMGFGQLLLPINKAINSLINQLIDAGTVSVTQGGFLGKGLRLKGGELRFKPFEWKVLDAASGTDLEKNVFPFPVREPSQTLLQLLTVLINVGKDLTSTTEAMNGSMSGANVASSTLNGLIEQGSKVFEAIHKRFYDSLTLTYQKQYVLNYYNLPNKEYQKILDDPRVSVKMDFALDFNDVRPVADPQLSSMAQRLQKAQVLLALKTADPRAIDIYMLQTMHFEKEQIAAFCPPPNPNAPPPPETVKTMAQAELFKMQAAQIMQETNINMQYAPLDAALKQKDLEVKDSQVQEASTRAWGIMKDKAHGDQKIMLAGTKMANEQSLKQFQAQQSVVKNTVDSTLQNKDLNIKAVQVAGKHEAEMKKLAIQKDEANDNNDDESGQN